MPTKPVTLTSFSAIDRAVIGMDSKGRFWRAELLTGADGVELGPWTLLGAGPTEEVQPTPSFEPQPKRRRTFGQRRTDR
jgi:hypothetical protein